MTTTGGTSGGGRGRIASGADQILPAVRAPIDQRHRYLVVIVGLAILALVAPILVAQDVSGRGGLSPEIIIIAVGLGPLLGAAVVDLHSGRLPDRLVAPAGLVAAIAIVNPVVEAGAVDVLSGAIVGAGPLLALHLVSPDALGFGDVKAAAAAGGLLGIVEPLAVPIMLAIAAGITAIAALALRRRSLPFGPGLVIGLIVALGLSSAVMPG